MTCMNHHDISLPPHLMIPNTYTLPHLVSSIAPSSSTHSSLSLLHQPRAIPYSSIPRPRAHQSHQQRLRVPCPSCGRLYVARGTCLAHHQTSCTTHMPSLAFEVLML
jgi:hypothetical protein